MADGDDVVEVEVSEELVQIGGICVHVVTVPGLRGAAGATTVMSNRAEAVV
jgi:hypothetical protein